MTSSVTESAPAPHHTRPAGPAPRELVQAAQALGDELALTSAERDAKRLLPHDAIERFRADRIGLVRLPASAGGAEGTVEDMAHIVMHLARGDSNAAQALLSHYVALERLRLMGSPAQQAHFLPLAAQGLQFGAAAAERGGPFRGTVNTRLVRQGNRFRLDGVKHYSTGSLFADILKIRAVDEDGQLVGVFVPRQRQGVHCLDDWDGMGQRCTASGTTELHGVEVEPHEVMSIQPWLAQRHHTGAFAQLIHCGIDVGIAQAALREAIDWAQKGSRPVKESGVQRAQDDPYVLHTVGRMSAQVLLAHAHVLAAARAIDAAADARFGREGRPGDAGRAEALAGLASVKTAEAKIVSTEVALAVTQLLFDVGGAATTLRRHNHDRHWRNARTHTTHDPVAYKFRAVGRYHLDGEFPPLTFSY